MFGEWSLFVFVLNVSEALMGIGLLLCFVRIAKGPSLPDRVIALDVSTTMIVGIIAIESIATDQPILLRIAVVITMLSFLGTIAFANYISKEKNV